MRSLNDSTLLQWTLKNFVHSCQLFNQGLTFILSVKWLKCEIPDLQEDRSSAAKRVYDVGGRLNFRTDESRVQEYETKFEAENGRRRTRDKAILN